MRYVILRDDDTNALTPVECLETLYRPFLNRGLTVSLATIPEVHTDACATDGRRERFLWGAKGGEAKTLPISGNARLTAYLRSNPGFEIVQHGCFHDPYEFDSENRPEIVRRLELGAQRLNEAGLQPASAFVAPHDKLSSVAYVEAARRFRVISTGWFEWRRVPPAWRLRYLVKKVLRQPHWRIGRTHLLSHPGCLLSYTRPPESILPAIRRAIAARPLTVLVTHWWEYFRDGHPDARFIAVLHETAEYLSRSAEIEVVSFGTLAAFPAREAAPVGPLADPAHRMIY
jgi:hypothetical protein